MLKNVILPFVSIILTSAGTVYCWFSRAPISLFGVIGFFTLGLGSMYISYYIFYRIFPDDRNVDLPKVTEFASNFNTQKNNQQIWTKGSIFGGLCTLFLITLGIYSWTVLATKYRKYQLENFGQITSSLIIEKGYSKGIGKYREYEYKDIDGSVYTDRFSNDYLAIGDTIKIMYSSKRPTINRVIWPHDQD